MIVTRYSRCIALLLMSMLLACGCGRDETVIDRLDTPVEIEFYLAPGTLIQEIITSMKLTVTNSDTGELRDFQRIDIDPEELNIREKVLRSTLPAGEPLTFSVKAFDSGCPVLTGETRVDRVENGTVIIDLSSQIIIGIRSDQEQVRPGDAYVLEVYVEDANRLAAFACELGFSEDLLEPVHIEPGDLFGEKGEFLFLEDSEFPDRRENKITLAFARKADNRGVCGSGTASKLTFRAKGTGIAIIEILDNDALTLKNDAYEDIRDHTQVKLEARSLIIE